MTTLILVRHGETALNADSRYQGLIDEPLSPRGREQAMALHDQLHSIELPITALEASDRLRARQTAELALPGVEVRTDHRLRELRFGAFEGLTHDECMTRFPAEYSRWIADPVNCLPPGGETLTELIARVEDWLAEQTDEQVVVFTHKGVIHVLLALVHRVSYHAARSIDIAPGEAIRLLVRERPMLVGKS